jgi:prolyl oligopeptidase
MSPIRQPPILPITLLAMRPLLLLALVTTMTHAGEKLVYPATATGDTVDTLHGVAVPDPYRWLEDDNAPDTKKWVEAQNKVTFAYLNSLPGRDAIRARLTKLWNYERYGIPFKRGDRYFFTRNDGLQNQSVLYTTQSLDAAPTVLLDPNTLSKDGTVALTATAVTDDGTMLAYGVAVAGSDWQEYRVRDVATAADRSDVVRWVKFSSPSWTKDGRGFFYSRYDEPTEAQKLTKANYFHKLYYHKLGTPQSDDVLVYHRPDHKDWGFYGRVTDDGAYLIIHSSQGSSPKNRILYLDLATLADALKARVPVVTELLMAQDAEYDFVDNDGATFFFKTDKDAPRGRVIAIDTRKADPKNWREVIPQSDATLGRTNLVGGRFIAQYLKDARSQVKTFALDGKAIAEIPLPGVGSAGGFGGKRTDDETFYSFTSYTTPSTIYRLDLKSDQSTVFKRPNVDFNPDDYETRQVFVTSKDGTRLPMFISSKKGIKLDGTNPTILYGYGGFAVSLTPGFSPANLAWMEMGGVYAVPNLRGGGEYGDAWHQAGIKLKKQNVFDDFIAAAQYLIDHKVTSSSRLAISGGSNGGLLVGAAMTQRPDLFAAAVPAVGVMDMLRFHKFTIGWAWTTDYGSADDDPEMFKALLAYSPYHNLKPGTRYPATMVTTGDHDDRVVPAHSFKFAARLQACQTPDRPALIRIETRSGHGAGTPTAKQVEYQVDVLSFLAAQLGVTRPPP